MVNTSLLNTLESTSTSAASVTPALVSLGDSFISISEADYKKLAFIINGVAIPVISGLGLVGNGLGVGVLWRDSFRQTMTIYIYLWSLTLVDTIYLFFGLIRCIPDWVSKNDYYFGNWLGAHMILFSIYIDMVLSYTSMTIIIIMAVERLLALVRPFTVKHTWLTKHPRRIIIAVLVLNTLFFLPYPINFKVDSFMNFENRTEYYLIFDPAHAETMHMFTFAHTIINNFIPTVLLIVVNIAIPIAYSRVVNRRTTTLRMNDSAHRRQQTKITLVVLAITTMYILCQIPGIFIKTLAFINDGYSFNGEYKLSFWLFMDIVNIATYLNAANDFIIYILVSSHYRSVFKSLYCKPCASSDIESVSATFSIRL